jgi:hypothetical protein
MARETGPRRKRASQWLVQLEGGTVRKACRRHAAANNSEQIHVSGSRLERSRRHTNEEEQHV